MNYKAYPKEKDTPSRMSRKRARIDTFMKNKKMKKLAKKERLALRSEQEASQDE